MLGVSISVLNRPLFAALCRQDMEASKSPQIRATVARQLVRPCTAVPCLLAGHLLQRPSVTHLPHMCAHSPVVQVTCCCCCCSSRSAGACGEMSEEVGPCQSFKLHKLGAPPGKPCQSAAALSSSQHLQYVQESVILKLLPIRQTWSACCSCAR